MISRSGVTITAVVILAAVSAAFAKDGGPPSLDIEYTCHATVAAVGVVLGGTIDDFTACVDDEKQAREKLEKEWATFPASDKARCIHPKEYVPGYTEWLTCLEMERDVKVSRKDQPGPLSSADKCPVVNYLANGTILSVNTAC